MFRCVSQEAVDTIDSNTNKWQQLQDSGVVVKFPPPVVTCEEALKVIYARCVRVARISLWWLVTEPYFKDSSLWQKAAFFPPFFQLLAKCMLAMRTWSHLAMRLISASSTWHSSM